MGKKDIGRLIKGIRVRRGEAQGVFGGRLGISQGGVNKLENGTNRPDKLVCMALAALSSGEEREFFLRLAAGSVERLLPLLRDVAKAPSSDNFIRVSGLIHTPEGGIQEDPQLKVLASEQTAGRTAVSFFQIDGEIKAGFMKKGDVVILSRSADISRCIEPLILKPVLAKKFEPTNPPNPYYSVADKEREGFYFGLLHVREYEANEGTPLGPFVTVYGDCPEEFGYNNLGEVKVGKSDWKRLTPRTQPESLAVREIELSRLHYKLFAGVEILGEVIGWWRPGL